jgi:hypothetical protein
MTTYRIHDYLLGGKDNYIADRVASDSRDRARRALGLTRRPDLLAEAVNYLLDCPDAAARMAATARERPGTRFDVTTMRGVLVDAYTSQR